MSFWERFFRGQREEKPGAQLECVEEALLEPEVRYEEIPGTLDLGWYYSDNKDEFQMARIAEEDRASHFYVVGATGTGKTKLLEFLIQQDIVKGNGIAVIDPHGDLIENIKGFLACYYSFYQDETIFDRVVLIDPTDPDFTATFNPLEKLSGVSIAEQTAELVSAFKKIWSGSWGVRMEDLMRNSVIALGEAGLTLAELPRFLTDKPFRGAVLKKVESPTAHNYFLRFGTLTDRARVTWTEPVMNKINAFLSDDRIRQMFSFPKSTFNLREVMDHKKILLIKLDKGRLKGSADILGSLLMAKIQMATFSRSNVPQSRRVPFYIYIDEFQNFASESFSVMLSEARKYGVSLIMAHQSLSQIPTDLRGLILGNTGIQVYFRLNRRDASLLAKEAFEYSGYTVKSVSRRGGRRYWSLGEEWERYIGELQSLPPRICYVKHQIEGGIIPIQTAEIEAPQKVLAVEEDEYQRLLRSLPFGRKYLLSREKLKSLPRQRYDLLREEVEAAPAEEKEAVQVIPKPVLEVREPLEKEPAISFEEIRGKLPVLEEKPTRQHRYLQNLIKRMGQEKGYRATIEQPTPDGGRVDVALEREGERIACEISVSSTDEQELSNIKKCLGAGYDEVILCSPKKRTLEKVRTLVSQELKESDQGKVLFFQPEELFSHLEQKVALEASKEEKVKGYKVKVQYQPLTEEEKKTKRETVAQVILRSVTRLKEKEET